MVAAFDYSRLSPEFGKLSKPAQRALLNNGIATATELSRHTREEIAEFHGIGPSSFPLLEQVLKKHGLQFRK